jgi:phosphoglycolate phosphatase
LNIELILFDIDGTLVVTRGAGRTSTKLAMLEIFGTDAGLDNHHFGGKTDWKTLTELLADRNYTHQQMLEFIPRYEEAIGRHLGQIIGGFQVTACPGAMETVEALRRRGAPTLGILTGNVSTTAPIKLRAAGYDPAWFPVAAYGSEALERDDLPALALERANRLTGRNITPEQVMVIGDTPADISCARALGAVAVAVKTGFSEPHELAEAKPDYLLDDLHGFVDTFLS